MARSSTRHRNPWTDTDVARHWDQAAPVYLRENERVRHAHRQRFSEALRWLDLFPGARLLNVSSRDCGADDALRRECAGVEVVHAEVSSGLIRLAARLRPGARQCRIGSYSRLPFASGAFERLLSLETLEHAAEPLAFLRELHRVAAGGSRLVLSCPPATAEIPYRLYTLLLGGHGEGPHRFLPSRRVKALLEEAGWELETHRGTLLVPVGPRFLRRWGERIIDRFQSTFISELGIRQFYVCRRA